MRGDIPEALRAETQQRAHRRCEYCLLHVDDSWEPHQPDHVIARKHRGQTESENLAWTCAVCNRHKGSDLASIDEQTVRIVRLYQPRRDRWSRHFRLDGGRIIARTAIGRVTEFLLQLNRPDRVRNRQILAEKGLYPR
jgi:5-methylcytosine-specific restriction endonuclease McrA